MRYMLDTNICIYLMANRPAHLMQKFKKIPLGDVVMSVVTHAELSHGVERYEGSLRQQAAGSLLQLIRLIPVLSFDTQASTRYGVLAAAIRDRRRDAMDRLIAAHAVAVNAILVTNNEADFLDYPGLQIENWTNP